MRSIHTHAPGRIIRLNNCIMQTLLRYIDECPMGGMADLERATEWQRFLPGRRSRSSDGDGWEKD